MSINFEYIKIDKLLEANCNYYRQPKEFTLDELAQYNGKYGKAAYVAIGGVVYDVSNESINNIGTIAGKDLTEQLDIYSRIIQITNVAPKIGVIDDNNNIESKINSALYKQENQISCQLGLNQWSDYTEYLKKEVMNRRKKKVTKKNYTYKEWIPLDKLVELENVLKDTFNQVLELQIEMLKCTGKKNSKVVATEVVEKPEEIIGIKSSNVEGLFGGAAGGALGSTRDLDNAEMRVMDLE